MLRATGTDIWECKLPHRVGPLELGRRLTIVRLPDGALWVHASLPPSRELREQIAALGEVRFIIGPNRWHDDYLAEFARAYPRAELWLAPGLAEANRALPASQVLRPEPNDAWADVLDQHLVAGMPKLNEIVFLHRPSSSLILADLAFNLQPPKPLLTRLLMTLNGSYGRLALSRAGRSFITNREAFRRSIEHLTSWSFRRIVVGHGENVENDALQEFKQAFAFAR